MYMVNGWFRFYSLYEICLKRLKMSSDECTIDKLKISRLGECEVCGERDAIYTCPKCEVKTCCLSCVRIHKKELECDGVRDRTKFIHVKDFTDTDMLSDYRLLEECARFVYGVKRNDKKKFTRIDKDLPVHLFKLKVAARKKGIVLQFLAQNFSRHICNTTRYNYKTRIISWRVEWVFPNAEPEAVKFVDEKCPEDTRLSILLDKYINPEKEPFEGSKALTFYRSLGFSGLKILLKAEKISGSAKKFFELDPAESLANNLCGKCVVEFPVIFVVLKDHAYNFNIIGSDDEFDNEETVTNVEKNKIDVSKDHNSNNSTHNSSLESEEQNNQYKVYNRKRPRLLLTEKIAKEKKMELQKEIKAEKKKKPRNLLFTTEYSSEESLSDGTDNV